MKAAHLLVSCVFLVSPSALVAQYATPYGPVPGSRVRVLAPAHANEPVTGRLVAFAGDSLLLGASSGRARVRLSAAAVDRLDVSDGFARWETATRYGVAGGVVGGVIGAISFGPHDPLGGLAGLVAGALVGAPLAAAAGAILAPERWRSEYAGSGVGHAAGSYQLAIDPRTDVRFASRVAPASITRGEVALVAGDTLFLVPRDSRGARSVRLSDLALLQVRGGRDHPRGVTYGAVAFALVTAVAGGIDVAHGAISTGDVLASMAGNALVGGLVGYALAPAGWESLALPRR